ncbi:hypothetical protein AC623_00825 [Bacillus sp. FJAT-27231]|uniref:hypothetical protein n=1 Tax=Bacillus sp. FJAT-27231 TaxID=1679168 RepID=UPI0006710A50|nr:hypothetical protein [Bacillus sp. FJAT-27231]KMY52704.1 hypothetical protein AC623_00825 [Bacillus sp. FJAT-27231]
MFINFILLAAGCADTRKLQTSASTNLTIEPYSLNKREKELISKTGADQIEFFKLNGTLKKGDDIQYTVVLYRDGKFEQNMLVSFGEIKHVFRDKIISFGTSDTGTGKHSMKLLEGSPDGLATIEFEYKMWTWSFSSLVHEKITLKKDKHVYLTGWASTTNNSMMSLNSEHGELPQGLKETEIALLYKVEWTKAQKKDITD